MDVKLISWTKDPISTCAKAASMCYKSEPNTNIVKGCIKSGHTSILEMANYTFEITGVSRALLAQLTRHRHASYAVESQRYCTYSDMEFIFPKCDKDGLVQNVGQYTLDAYKEMINDGWKAEDARAVLPNATPTNLVCTFNLRSLMNFMNERLCMRSQSEIRDLAYMMRKEVINCPEHSEEDKKIIMMVLVPKCEKHSLSFCTEYKSCGRHKKLDEIKDILLHM